VVVRNCLSVAGSLWAARLRRGACAFGDASRLRFDCVDALLPEGVLDRVRRVGTEVGSHDEGNDSPTTRKHLISYNNT
jgi:hypothetical protein